MVLVYLVAFARTDSFLPCFGGGSPFKSTTPNKRVCPLSHGDRFRHPQIRVHKAWSPSFRELGQALMQLPPERCFLLPVRVGVLVHAPKTYLVRPKELLTTLSSVLLPLLFFCGVASCPLNMVNLKQRASPFPTGVAGLGNYLDNSSIPMGLLVNP